MTDEVTELPMENLTGGRAFVENPMTIGPTSSWTPEETIKLTEEPLSQPGGNWLSDPFMALAGLIPATLMADTIALSPKETMDKMSHHFLDVSFLSFHFDRITSFRELMQVSLFS
jgi:hypothetical protein